MHPRRSPRKPLPSLARARSRRRGRGGLRRTSRRRHRRRAARVGHALDGALGDGCAMLFEPPIQVTKYASTRGRHPPSKGGGGGGGGQPEHPGSCGATCSKKRNSRAFSSALKPPAGHAEGSGETATVPPG
jgi:hypothetical protein